MSDRSAHAVDDVVRVLRDDGSLDPELDPRLSAADLEALYGGMTMTRVLDERLTALQRQGRIGFHVGSLGEEGCIIASAFAMRPNDWLFPCYREFGAALLRGLPLQTFVDNMFGNARDVVKGRQMPDHYTCKRINWASISSPVGTQIPHAVGVAWAARIRREDVAALVYFGDGATSSSDFHAGMNWAGVFKAPTIFLCRNNGWAISTPLDRQTATRTFAEKASAYGIPGVRVDGNDVFAMVAVVREAIERARRGDGPTLIEALTYRMGGHSTSDDPNRYRDDQHLAPWMRRDPIERLRKHLISVGVWSVEKETQLLADIERRFREAVQSAERVGPPALETMHEDVYARPPWHLAEQRAELLAGPRGPRHGA